MAEDLAAIRNRVRGVQQLDAVIGAMRGIAAAHAQQSRALLPGFHAYADVIARAIASASRLVNDGRSVVASGGQARIVFSAEQGFVGGFAEHVLDAACQRESPVALLLIGSRGLSLAVSRGLRPMWQSAMATQVNGITALCIRIADALYELLPAQRIGAVEVVFPEWTAGAGMRITCRSLLPLDATRFHALPATIPPLTTLPPERLLQSLAEEYVYASLCEAAMHAFVAENEARAAAMVRARGKVHEILDDLHLSEHRVRQEAITAELVELVGGSRTNAQGC